MLEQLTTLLTFAVARLRDDERGQGMTEYMGVIVVIAAIIAALAANTTIPTTIGNAIVTAVGWVLNGRP